jgi:hypothetical protein
MPKYPMNPKCASCAFNNGESPRRCYRTVWRSQIDPFTSTGKEICVADFDTYVDYADEKLTTTTQDIPLRTWTPIGCLAIWGERY